MSGPLHLFEGVGIEIEYMIVDRETLAVRPITDDLLTVAAGGRVVGGRVATEVERGALAWSNELVLHVVELKTNGPAKDVDVSLLRAFEDDVREIDRLLAQVGARLLPTAMHPWMDPLAETVIWPHGYNVVYRAYDRIFDCRGHGWSNLQSLHLNFPFEGDEEFGRLHAAVRLLLPVLPALAASSPIVEGRVGGPPEGTVFPALDQRMAYYKVNSARVPSLTGLVIPEPVFDHAAYQSEIFDLMDREMAPHDPDGVLVGQPFLNARGAIARFDRGAIEIRVIDVQETPRADLAVAALCHGVLRLLARGEWSSQSWQRSWSHRDLAEILGACILDGDEAELPTDYAAVFGLDDPEPTGGSLWRHLLDQCADAGEIGEPWAMTADQMISEGPLARRILRALGDGGPAGPGDVPDRRRVERVYRRLAECLVEGELFRA